MHTAEAENKDRGQCNPDWDEDMHKVHGVRMIPSNTEQDWKEQKVTNYECQQENKEETLAHSNAQEHVESSLSIILTKTTILALDTDLAKKVIGPSLFSIRQDIIRIFHLLELLRISSLVWVMLHGKLAVRLFDLAIAGVLVYLKQLIKLCGIRIFARSATTTRAIASTTRAVASTRTIADIVVRKFEKKKTHPNAVSSFTDVKKEEGGLGGIAAAAANLAGPANPNTEEVDKEKNAASILANVMGGGGGAAKKEEEEDHKKLKLAHEIAPGEHEHDAKLYVNPRLNPAFHAAHHHGIHDRRVESRDSLVGLTVGTAIRINDLKNRLMAKKRKKEEDAAAAAKLRGESVPEASAKAAPTEEKAVEKKDEEEESSGIMDKVLEIMSKPLELAMEWTIPDCREEAKEHMYLVTFSMSIIWIGVLSYLMVDFAARAGCVLRVPGILMGLVVIAAGTSVPDALSSVLVAKNGQGDMAVANVLGSNVFNIFLGLGLPWLIKALSDGHPVKLPKDENIVVPIVILLFYVVVFIAIIAASGWAMRPKTGDWLFAAHIIFVVWNIITMFPANCPLIDLDGKC